MGQKLQRDIPGKLLHCASNQANAAAPEIAPALKSNQVSLHAPPKIKATKLACTLDKCGVCTYSQAQIAQGDA